MKNSEQPAMPVHKNMAGINSKGMTKREYFAGLAMQGILSNPENFIISMKDKDKATFATLMADELLKQLSND